MERRTGLVLDEIFTRHLVPEGFPERVERITSIKHSLEESGLADRCKKIEPAPAADDHLSLVHSPPYIARVKSSAETGQTFVDTPECPLCPESYRIALLATGSLISAVDLVMSGEISNAFCVVRPPGHHAEREVAMGFCLFNSVAIAAAHLVANHGLERVLVFDWDVHHGNGTQHSFEENGKIFFASIHGHPATLYPGTGFAEERGRGPGEGKILNMPMPPGSGDSEYRSMIEGTLLPAVRAFDPQFVLISAGFDAFKGDPIGDQNLEIDSFRWLTEHMLQLAEDCSGGRLVSVLEGGYDLPGLASCSAAHLETLLNWRA